MNRLLFFSLCCLQLMRPHAQVLSEPGDLSDLLFSRKHFSLSIMGGLAVKADVRANPLAYKLGSSHQVAFGAGLNYHQNYTKRLSLITGLHFAAPVRNMEYYISKDEFSPAMPGDLFHNKGISRIVVFLLHIPVTLEYRWFSGDKNYMYLAGGLSLNYTPLQEEEETHYAVDVSGQSQRYFHLRLSSNNNKLPWLNYHIGGGHGWMLKNKDLIAAGITAHLSLTRFIKGDFSVEVDGRPAVDGQYSFKGSYAGFTVSYIYTGSRKRWKELMRK